MPDTLSCKLTDRRMTMLPYTDEPPTDLAATLDRLTTDPGAAPPILLTEPRECAWLRDAVGEFQTGG